VVRRNKHSQFDVIAEVTEWAVGMDAANGSLFDWSHGSKVSVPMTT